MAPFATPPDLGGTSPPQIPDHELLRCIGSGSYGEVWLARNVMGTYRAVKVIYRATFSDDRPYEREYHGMQRFEPVSRSHDGLVDILQIGRNNTAGYFYYVMELWTGTRTSALIWRRRWGKQSPNGTDFPRRNVSKWDPRLRPPSVTYTRMVSFIAI